MPRFAIRPRPAAALLLAGILVLPAPRGAAAADPATGQSVFKTCAACHAVEPGKKKLGPSLHGVVGRKAGSVAGFNYSKAMKNAGHVWSEANLDAYLTNPRKFVPGNRMPFPGLKDAGKRADVIAYLATLK